MAPPEERLPGRVVDVSAGEFFLRAPDTIPAGLTTFRLHQVGEILTNPAKVRAENLAPATPDHDPTRAFHMLWVVRLDARRTVDEWYRAHVRGEPTPWAIDLGGPASTDPPRTSNATMVLEPGTYVLVCHVGSARADRNRSHLLKGMFRQLTVVRSTSPLVALPQPDVVARISSDGRIQLSGPVRKGRQVIRVINETSRSYEFIMNRVKEGRTAGELVTWKRTDGTTNPSTRLGGLSDVPPGATRTITEAFVPGMHVFWTVRGPATSVAVNISER
ncbi:MAG: hypothetical protein H0W42_06370 [Gemmatimonadaceae bacterium]|nr:hypothetical protein [Gemmatimonadaceae bacterium]